MLGERVAGKYELTRLLGTGSMGAVYEGVHVDIGKRLAIKVIHPEFCGSAEVVARFRREARAASAVESDYIAQIYDFGRDDAAGLYMVIEYLDGEDLETRLARERWSSERDAVTIGVQVARGLAKAHAAGIIHRDLKPANIFLTERDDDGSILAKILDFGISKFDADVSSTGEPITAFGTTLGTPQYMSPEQCDGKLALDARTDVWSLSAVLYEMLAGEPAVSHEGGYVAMMERIVRSDLPPLRGRASWVSERLAQIVDAGLVRNREVRTRSALALMSRLVEAFPDAGARTSLGRIERKTDVSELAPHAEALSSQKHAPASDPDASPVTVSEPAGGLVVPINLADTANPATAKPPSSAEPPSSSNDDSVAIFVRGQDLPQELLALRKNRKP